MVKGVSEGWRALYTLHSTLYTLHPALYTLSPRVGCTVNVGDEREEAKCAAKPCLVSEPRLPLPTHLQTRERPLY